MCEMSGSDRGTRNMHLDECFLPESATPSVLGDSNHKLVGIFEKGCPPNANKNSNHKLVDAKCALLY